ncbi:MAG: hypothetical protein NW224_12350 [Leptolyngbyaceae cyanobacterium bins.302]|nr:hypothetical protein [Leptolyngbyaceae cyanobacterium bins.302]
MVDQHFPGLPSDPLKRLRVHDNLIINAERWSQAHNYHRDRQNIHYQALNQAGILYGLGVKVLDKPPEYSSKEIQQRDKNRKEKRWLEIQPGIAIDYRGHPIVVTAEPQANRVLRIAVDPPNAKDNLFIYIVVSYVDPDELDSETEEIFAQEQFRFDQKISSSEDVNPLSYQDIELCRIKLQAGILELKPPKDVLSPNANEIDLRYRQHVQPRTQFQVEVGTLSELEPSSCENFNCLMRSLSALYPQMNGVLNPASIELSALEQRIKCDLLYLESQKFLDLKDEQLKILRRYCQKGGNVLVEIFTDIDIQNIESRVQEGEGNPELFSNWDALARENSPIHPLRIEPFTFPKERPGFIQEFFVYGGFIGIKGKLSESWGVRSDSNRELTRTAQEFGINILHFAWQRRYFSQLVH